MTDYLNIKMTPQEINAVSNLGLAHLGDCVYELLARSYVVTHGELRNQDMHLATVGLVCARAQAAALETLRPMLTEEESEVCRRGRNAKVNSVPKHADLGDYHAATALECLFGWLYLNGRHERINALFAAIMEEH